MRIKLDQVYSRAGGIVIQPGVYDIGDKRLRGLGPYLVESRHAHVLSEGGIYFDSAAVVAKFGALPTDGTLLTDADTTDEKPKNKVEDEDNDSDESDGVIVGDQDDDIPEDLEALTVSELQALVNTYDLTVTGTGKDGRVLKQDLIAALEEAT